MSFAEMPATEIAVSQMGFLLLERVEKSPYLSYLVRRVNTDRYNWKFGQVLQAALERQGEQARMLDCTSLQANFKDLQSAKNLIPYCHWFEFRLISHFWDCDWNNDYIWLNHGRRGGWDKAQKAWADIEKLLEIDTTLREHRSWVSGIGGIGEIYQYKKL